MNLAVVDGVNCAVLKLFNLTLDGVHKLEWLQFYFSSLSDNKYRCNVCQSTLETTEEKKSLDFQEHIQNQHKEIQDLHKENPEDSVPGFRIEFLHVLPEDNVKTSTNVTEATEPKKQVSSNLDENIEFVIASESKKQVASNQDENIEFVILNEPSTPKEKNVKYVSTSESRKRSWVWKYFEKLSSVIFRCNMCNVVLSIKGSNTNNMNRHVKTKHPSIYKAEMVNSNTRRKDPLEQVTDVGCEVEISNSLKSEDVSMSTSTPKGRENPTKIIKRSWIWDHFNRLSATIAECNICHRKINHGGNATGNMNRHLKFLHKTIYLSRITETNKIEDVNWVWKLFSIDEDNFYSCKICNFKCLKFHNIDKSVSFILGHLKMEHGVISGDQIISGTDETLEMDECTVAVDFLKGSEEL